EPPHGRSGRPRGNMRKRYGQELEIIFTERTSRRREASESLDDLERCSPVAVVVPVVPVVVPVVVEVAGDGLDAGVSRPVTCTLWPRCISRSLVLPSSFQVFRAIAVPDVPVGSVVVVAVPVVVPVVPLLLASGSICAFARMNPLPLVSRCRHPDTVMSRSIELVRVGDDVVVCAPSDTAKPSAAAKQNPVLVRVMCSASLQKLTR